MPVFKYVHVATLQGIAVPPFRQPTLKLVGCAGECVTCTGNETSTESL